MKSFVAPKKKKNSLSSKSFRADRNVRAEKSLVSMVFSKTNSARRRQYSAAESDSETELDRFRSKIGARREKISENFQTYSFEQFPSRNFSTSIRSRSKFQ